MKHANTFYWTFIDTLIYNVATIAAIVVGIVQFAVRAYKENNGSAKIRQFVIQTLRVINALSAQIYQVLDHDLPPVETVPVGKVAQKRTKRA